MKKIKEKMKLRRVSKKSVIMILLLISFLMTSSTFAYWAGIVEGTQNSITSTFVVGSPIYDNHEFVLTSEVNTYSYEIDLLELLDNPEENIDEVIFGLVWNDESISDEVKDQILTGELNLDFDIYMTKANGKELTGNRYKRYSSLINIEIDQDNPSEVEYNDTPDTLRFSISLTEENKRNDYKNLAKYKAYVVISFDVEYELEDDTDDIDWWDWWNEYYNNQDD